MADTERDHLMKRFAQLQREESEAWSRAEQAQGDLRRMEGTQNADDYWQARLRVTKAGAEWLEAHREADKVAKKLYGHGDR